MVLGPQARLVQFNFISGLRFHLLVNWSLKPDVFKAGIASYFDIDQYSYVSKSSLDILGNTVVLPALYFLEEDSNIVH